ncbi:hypothetical protein EV651_11289 [Kribbella sp. VKM Ac-2571]|nr:hypothetical protein EV651_11289 [Kribbella sp. VKM Ac-2571]
MSRTPRIQHQSAEHKSGLLTDYSMRSGIIFMGRALTWGSARTRPSQLHSSACKGAAVRAGVPGRLRRCLGTARRFDPMRHVRRIVSDRPCPQGAVIVRRPHRWSVEFGVGRQWFVRLRVRCGRRVGTRLRVDERAGRIQIGLPLRVSERCGFIWRRYRVARGGGHLASRHRGRLETVGIFEDSKAGTQRSLLLFGCLVVRGPERRSRVEIWCA